ncbi:MAG: M1 family aminopeptidase [Planctomycetota bacterium]
MIHARLLCRLFLLLLVQPVAFGQGFAGTPVPDYGDLAERERQYDLQHVKIEARLEIEQGRIEGRVTHRIEMLRDGLTRLVFDAEGLNIQFAAISGRKLPFSQDGRELRIDLDAPASAGDLLEVEIAYDGAPGKGLYFVRPEPGYPDRPRECWTQGQDEDNHFWVPIYDAPNDRTSFETLLTVPKDLTAVSNGELVSVEPAEDGWHTFHHVMKQPNSTYLIAFAVGPFERYSDTWRNKQIEYFVAEGVGEEKARRSFGMTPEVIEFFSARTGVEYPWSRYAQVAVAQFVVGGMENVSCTLQTDRTLHDAIAALEESSQGLVAHEAAHQWFGDLVTCRTWSDLWLNEGFATYFEELYREHHDGVDDFRLAVLGSQESFMRSDPPAEPCPMVADFFSRKSGRKSNHVYSKGASVLHMLRFVLGDEPFFKSIQLFLERHRMGLVETRDFQIAVADATGRNLEWFFEQWVFLAGYPQFKVRFDYDEPAKTGTMTVEQTQKTGGLVPVFRTPVDVEFVVDGVSEMRRIFVEEQTQEFTFPLEGRPSRVRFDKGGWIVKSLDFERSLDEWIEIAEQDKDVIGRLLAVRALKEINDPRATGCLAGVLLSLDHDQVRQEAADGLASGERGDAAVRALLSALEIGRAPVRARVVRALRNFKGAASVPARLREILATDPAYGPRMEALRSLVKLGVEDAFDIAELGLIIPSDGDRVACAALAALVDVDPRRAAPYVVTAATYGISIDLRHEALRQVGRIAGELTESEREEAVEVVRSGLRDDYSRTRSSTIRALQALQAREALDDLDRLATEDPNRRVRATAERAAERIRQSE